MAASVKAVCAVCHRRRKLDELEPGRYVCIDRARCYGDLGKSRFGRPAMPNWLRDLHRT